MKNYLDNYLGTTWIIYLKCKGRIECWRHDGIIQYIGFTKSGDKVGSFDGRIRDQQKDMNYMEQMIKNFKKPKTKKKRK